MSVIIIIVIIVIIVNRKTNKGKNVSEMFRPQTPPGNTTHSPGNTGTGTPVYGSASRGSTGRGGISPSNPVMQTRNMRQVLGETQGAGTATRQGSQAGRTGVIGGVLDMDGDGEISTTEYLAQKAREDEAEHRKDEYETRQKLTQGGKLQLGGRIPDDGVIPPHARLVCCGYCGAENVIPRGAQQRAYHCYFCHEQL